jgi:hypothetical protein
MSVLLNTNAGLFGVQHLVAFKSRLKLELRTGAGVDTEV